MSTTTMSKMTAPPSTAQKMVDVPEAYADMIKRHGIPGYICRRPGRGEPVGAVRPQCHKGTFVETFDVWWFISHYESYCREHGIPVHKQLYI